MSNRNVSENSDSISLFPFLAVLLCTMGALLVLLVVLVQRATEKGLLAQLSELKLVSATVPKPENLNHVRQLEEELAELDSYQQELAKLREEANRRLKNEQLRLSHSEQHARRLEEELAKLAIAAAQLKQTEENQLVDQQQAEREVARLEKLVADTRQQIEELRAQSGGKHSYAIVPYKGPNGTYRRPIYIECSGEGITLHPEGIRLKAEDFIAPHWPGNPLAAALRASREYLNDKAAKAGDYAPPDPYPLMIIRPDGIQQYALARAAITSWDADYGYEFIDKDMQLSFPELADPNLARAQQHAIIIARDRLQQLAQAAPSRFRGMGLGASMAPTYGDGDVAGGYGYGSTGTPNAEEDRYLATSSRSGDGTEESSGNAEEARNPLKPGEMTSPEGGSGKGGDLAGSLSAPEADGAPASADDASPQKGTDESVVGSRYAQGEPASAGGSSQQANSPSADQSASKSGSCSNGSCQQPSSGGSPTLSFTNKKNESIAATQGANWAVERANQHSVPIRRSIRVVVREDQIALLPSKNAAQGKETTGQIISLNQPIESLSREFVSALRERIEEWGLAGSGMYWRPVLELNVGPDAQMTATRVVSLLQDSGVDIQLPEATANQTNPTQSEEVRR